MRHLRMLVLLALATSASTTLAAQQQSWGKKPDQQTTAQSTPAKGQPAPKPIEWRRNHRDTRPPGWNQGRKQGWNGQSVPPGHVREVSEHHRHHHHHRRDERRWREEHERERHHHYHHHHPDRH